VENLKDAEEKRVIKTYTYKWEIFIDTDGLTDCFTVCPEKQVRQPLVFKRVVFLNDFEIKFLN